MALFLHRYGGIDPDYIRTPTIVPIYTTLSRVDLELLTHLVSCFYPHLPLQFTPGRAEPIFIAP